MSIKLGANYTKTSDYTGTAITNIALAGDIVKVDPFSVIRSNDSFCTKNHTVFFSVCKAIKYGFQIISIEFLGGFSTEADKDFISMMVMMIVVMAT